MRIALSGAHGTGKTTGVFELAVKYKKETKNQSVTVLTENASHSPLPINKGTTKYSQYWIFCDQLRKEIELDSKYNIIICDRTIIDPIAYTSVSLPHEIEFIQSMKDFAINYLSTYDQIIFKKIETNDYHFNDGIRDYKDKSYRKQVEDKLLEIYDELYTKKPELRERFIIS